jgi:lipopolysaccharide/colanic/teichoic acid biosynthesis glycosyltransferase
MLHHHNQSSSHSPVLPLGSTEVNGPADHPMECSLRWRQGRLWVSSILEGQDVPLPALAHADWFLACLTKSRAMAVCIDPSLGAEAISLWAQACQVAQKPLFVRIPATPHRPANQKPRAWAIKRGCDRAVTILLLALLSPLLLLVAGLIKLSDQGPLLSPEWRVGQRGQLFQLLKFRTTVIPDHSPNETLGLEPWPPELVPTPVGRWLRLSHLDKLPLLFNVLWGDISLVGPHAWTIHETLALPPELRARMHTLPGITGSLLQIAHFPVANSKLPVLKELGELQQWSLWKDLKQLTMTTLQVFS